MRLYKGYIMVIYGNSAPRVLGFRVLGFRALGVYRVYRAYGVYGV